MGIVVSDANVLIDLVDGEIASSLRYLPYQIVVPETLFEEELMARHGNLLDFGISIESMSGDSILKVERQIRRHPRISGQGGQSIHPLCTGDVSQVIGGNASQLAPSRKFFLAQFSINKTPT